MNRFSTFTISNLESAHVIRRILGIYKNYKMDVAILLGIIFLAQATAMVNPYIFGKLIDSITKRNDMWWSIELATSTLVLVAIRYYMAQKRAHVNMRRIWFPIQEYLRFNTLDKYLEFSMGQHRNQHSGVNAEITSSGENALQRLGHLIVTMLVPMAIRFLITTVMLLTINKVLGIIVFVGLSFYAIGQYVLEGKYSSRIKVRRDTGIESSRYRGEVMRGAVLIKAASKEEYAKESYKEKYDKNVAANLETNFYIVKWDGRMNILVELTQYTALVAGIVMVFKGQITPGELITANIWCQQATGMISQVGEQYQDILELVSQIKKFFELLDLKPAIKEVERPIKLERPEGNILFRNISFCYPLKDGNMGKSVLKDVTLAVPSGKKVAIVGPSGSGKTTLITLLLRGYDPDKGTIEIDGNDLRDLSLRDYYKHVAVVDQSTLMMDGTVRDNILLGTHDKLTDKELKNICTTVELDLDSLEQGLDTPVGQEGKLVSGGERQRIAIARALSRDPKILILDEATASLDGIIESKIQSAIDKASAGRTTIIIAHRIATIQNADIIFLMDHGSIIDSGTHAELMRHSTLYRQLVLSQRVECFEEIA